MDPLLTEIVDKLLFPAWRGINENYKLKYARSIWQQFEDNIRSAAYTSKLSTFIDVFSCRMQVQFRGADVESVNATMTMDQRQVLAALRTEAVTLTLMTRLKNDARREERDHENLHV